MKLYAIYEILSKKIKIIFFYPFPLGQQKKCTNLKKAKTWAILIREGGIDAVKNFK